MFDENRMTALAIAYNSAIARQQREAAYFQKNNVKLGAGGINTGIPQPCRAVSGISKRLIKAGVE